MTATEKNRSGKFHSLTVILALSFLALSALVLLIATSLEVYFKYKSQVKIVSSEQQLIAGEAANSVKAFIQKKTEILKAGISIGNLALANHEDQILILDKLLGLEPSFRQLILLDRQQHLLLQAGLSPNPVFTQSSVQSNSDLISRVSQGKTYLSQVYIEKATSEPVMMIGVPVKDVLGNFKRTLIAEVNLKFMWDLVGSIEIGKTGVAYVVDKQGRLIAFEDISRVLSGENVEYLPEVAEFMKGNKNSHISNADTVTGIQNDQVVSTHVHLGNPDWAVIVELPVKEAYQPVLKTLKRSAIFMVVSIIFATMIGIYLSKKITKPIIDLRNATGKISRGDLDTKIKIISNNEIGELAKSFNQMVEDLNRTTVSRDHLAEEILERKKIEEALLQAKKEAEAASKAKGQFLANVSHEIRTPMNAILGFTKLLQASKLDKVQADYVETMHASGNLLLGLINDILDFSKVQEDACELESIDFDFVYLLESVISMIKSKMVESAVDVLYRIEEGPRFFKGDPTRIRQILINIINNAIKFTREGEIFTTVGIDPGDTRGGGEPGLLRTLRITVRDTGIGIPEEKRKSIFEAFTQADVSTTREYGGTGLGLSISKAFVEKMGGDIWVESAEEQGSEFIFTLKLEQAKAIIDNEIDPVSIESLQGKRVVIVDDNRNVCEIFREYCTTAKMEVPFAANSAREALDFLASAKTLPDIVICDMMMPEMDGYGFIEKIRKNERLKTLKIISATSEAIPGQSMDAKIKGFDGYLAKPVIRKELINIIRAVFGDKRQEKKHIITRHLVEEISYKGVNVLVAEDNPVNMKLIETLLKKCGINVDKAGNGEEAVEKINNNRSYDLVFMDMQMPGMNGIQATEMIRSTISKDIPIIALTAAVMKEDREKALAAGMNDFLEKPIDIDRLKSILQKFHAR
ncbi:MAG: response regulator [Desulfobacteraceae bacterium]